MDEVDFFSQELSFMGEAKGEKDRKDTTYLL